MVCEGYRVAVELQGGGGAAGYRVAVGVQGVGGGGAGWRWGCRVAGGMVCSVAVAVLQRVTMVLAVAVAMWPGLRPAIYR